MVSALPDGGVNALGAMAGGGAGVAGAAAAAHRAQADAVEIEAQAKRRLADEYDAAQQRGEVAGHGGERGNQHAANVPDGNVATVSDLGLTRKAIHEARQLRDAEKADPGVIRPAFDAQLAHGQEPTKAAVRV